MFCKISEATCSKNHNSKKLSPRWPARFCNDFVAVRFMRSSRPFAVDVHNFPAVQPRKIEMRRRGGRGDRFGGPHGRDAADAEPARPCQVPSPGVPDRRLGQFESGQSPGVRKRPRGLSNPTGAPDAGAPPVVDFGDLESSSRLCRLSEGGLGCSSETGALQRAGHVRPSDSGRNSVGSSALSEDTNRFHRVHLPSADAVPERPAALLPVVEAPISGAVARAGPQVSEGYLHRSACLSKDSSMDAAKESLLEAWNEIELKEVSPQYAEHFYLYKEARAQFLKNDLRKAADYCAHAKEATNEAVNTGKFSEADESRALFTQIGLLESLIAIERGEITDALKNLDMVLLLGTPNEGIARAADLVAEQLSKEKDSGDVNEPWEDDKKDFEGWKNFESVEEVKCPALETFWQKYMWKKAPVKITKSVEHFPARERWTMKYLLQVAGQRTVPVELGRDYTHPHWTQQLMPLCTFVKRHLLESSPVTGYLAQHSLFVQIPRLMDDLLIPDYCTSTPDINIWFGPKGTVSPLHHDPKHNLLTQIRGHKRILLFPPQEEGLYPFSKECLMSNTSQVDPENPDSEKFPEFSSAKGLSCVLGPGDVLYIPPKWWHHVRSLSASLSVSFWWE